jgi:hypothetical protein
MRKIVLLSFFAALVIVFLYRLTGVLAHGIAPTHNRRPTRAVPRNPTVGPGLRAVS